MLDPLASWTVTSPFGWRTHPVTGKRSFHKGVDLRAKVGTAVRAPFSGILSRGHDGVSGNYVSIVRRIGDYSIRALLCHLDSISAQAGPIAEGATVGTSGSSGRVTGPHLHYAVYLNANDGHGEMPINPACLRYK